MKNKPIIFLLTPQQWLGLLILVILAGVTLFCLHRFQPAPEPPMMPIADSTLTVFAHHQAQHDSLRRAAWRQQHPRDTIALHLQPFDPNTADSSTLVHLGLKPWQASNMLKYRAKNGRHRKAEDMRKLYGMTDSMYQALTPYIHIAREEGLRHTDSVQQDSIPKWPLKKDTILNLRTADTTELKLLRGIGSYRARQIVNYRQQLGGFTHIEQVLEAKGMQHFPDTILQHFFIDTVIIEPIDINRASAQRLARHPYLRFEQAQAIYQLRKRKMHLDSIPQLLEITDFSAETLQKLAPYLNFDKN